MLFHNNFNREYNTRKSEEKQVLCFQKPIHPEFQANPSRALLELLTPNKRVAFDRFIDHVQKNGVKPLPQKYWAKVFGVSHITAHRFFKDWEDLGLIYRIRKDNFRPYIGSEPDAYKLSDYFSFADIRSQLSKYLPSLKYLSLVLLSVMLAVQANDDILANQYYVKTLKEEYVLRNLNNIKGLPNSWIRMAKFSKWNGRIEFESVIPDYVQRISCIRLTRSGMIVLSAYPSDAITYAQNCLLRTKKFVKNPFAYFISICSNYCDDIGVKPEKDIVNKLKRLFRFRVTDAMLTSNAIFKRGISKKTTDSAPIKDAIATIKAVTTTIPNVPIVHNPSSSLKANGQKQSFVDGKNHKQELTKTNELTIAQDLDRICKKHDELDASKRRRNYQNQYAGANRFATHKYMPREEWSGHKEVKQTVVTTKTPLVQDEKSINWAKSVGLHCLIVNGGNFIGDWKPKESK